MAQPLRNLIDDLGQLPPVRYHGRVAAVVGMLVEIAGLDRIARVGSRCRIAARNDISVPCEIRMSPNRFISIAKTDTR